jgi:hypothetical protein
VYDFTPQVEFYKKFLSIHFSPGWGDAPAAPAPAPVIPMPDEDPDDLALLTLLVMKKKGPGRPRTSPNEVRSVTMSSAITSTESKFVRLMASKLGLSQSDYIRKIIKEKLKKSLITSIKSDCADMN